MFYPSVSVVIPLHNYEDFIKESINSVLSQTMSDFELIIVNDRSTDNSGEIAHSYLDPRIKVIDFPEHRGCYPARNAGMRVASGKYICVMDADDICLPKRLEKQYKFMEENLKIGLIGGDYRTMSSCLHIHTETNSETIKLMLLRSCALHHPTCMIRSSLLKKHNLYYNETYTYASDYDWQVRASSLFPVSNIVDPVLLYRRHYKQISFDKRTEQSFFADQIRINQLSFFGIEPTVYERDLHLKFIKSIRGDKVDEKEIDLWRNRLLESNRKTRYYSQHKLQDFLLKLQHK